MNEEEKKAIEIIKDEITRSDTIPLEVYVTDIKILLNLIDKQQKEIDKQNKVIDEMSEVLNDFDYDKQCEFCHTDICSASVDGTEYTKCIKQYFIRKVEENGKNSNRKQTNSND